MSPDDQQIALAKVHRPDLVREHAKADKRLKAVKNGVYPIIELEAFPDYLNDLNVCHELEQLSVLDGKWKLYEAHLKKLTPMGVCLWFATAEMRVEAFLRATNLWKD